MWLPVPNKGKWDIFMWNFLITTWLFYVIILNSQTLQTEEQFLSPLPCAIADGVVVSHLVSFGHIIHMTVIICHSESFHSILLLIADITFCLCIVNICKHLNVSLVSTVLLSCRSWSLLESVTTFHFYFLGSQVLWHDLPLCSDSPVKQGASWEANRGSVKELLHFIDAKGSLPHWQVPTIWPRPESDQSSPYLLIPLRDDPF